MLRRLRLPTLLPALPALPALLALLLLAPGLTTLAQDHGDDHEHDQSAPAASSDDHGAEHGDDHDHAHGEDGHGDDKGLAAAADIAVDEPPAWYGPVVIGIVVLFVLAMFVGSAAIIARGPEPPDPADPHAHGHGHDGGGHH